MNGIDVSGPHAADTLFYHAVSGKRFDALVTMYHDQALIPLKMLHFQDAINITLGLPFVRTSVDHGTAYDFGWQAKSRSLFHGGGHSFGSSPLSSNVQPDQGTLFGLVKPRSNF